MAEIARYPGKDAENGRALMHQFLAQKDTITAAMFSPPPSLPAAAAKFASSPAGMEAYRFSMQSITSWADETLDAEATKTLFGSFAEFLGGSPDDAGGAELGWPFASALQNAGNNLAKGGMHRVTLALAEDLRAHGGEIRTKARVEKILGEANRAIDVRLANGEEISASELIVSWARRVCSLSNRFISPDSELGQYKTPVHNVYLCSFGRHPGPDVSMAA